MDIDSERTGMNEMATGPLRYRVAVRGRLDADEAASFAHVEEHHEATPAAPVSTVVGRFADAAALTGLLNRVCDLGMALLSVEALQSTGATPLLGSTS